MKLNVEPRMSEINCYLCASQNVALLCHRCKRAMCPLHGPSLPPKLRFYEQVEDIEYSQLGLTEIGQADEAVHCYDCRHDTISYEPVFYLLGLFGLIIVVSSFAISFLLLALFFFLMGSAFGLVSAWGVLTEHNWRRYRMQLYRPPLPVFGRAASITVTEQVKGKAELTDTGRYSMQATSVRGLLNFSLLFAFHDQERLGKYLLKYQLPGHASIWFHAGFLTLYGLRNFYIENANGEQFETITLVGQVADQPFLASPATAREAKWSTKCGYKFQLDKQFTSGLPIQIIPTLISEQGALAIELLVQTNPKLDLNTLFQPVVTELKLELPVLLGEIENITPVPESLGQEIEPNRVTWRNMQLQESNSMYSQNFYVRFTSNVDNNLEPTGVARGKITVGFSGALSGLDDVMWFTSLGNKLVANKTITSKYTDVEINFEFNLDGLRVRRTYYESRRIEQTIIPSHEMITRLVNAMSDNNVYVQRVIENPAHTNRANAEIMNRLWVITGRRYKKALPIDLRVVVIGQEHYKETDIPYSGHARFEIATQGTTVENSTYNDVTQLAEDIVQIIQCTPEIEMWLTRNQLSAGEWGTIFGCIKNIGDVPVKKIHISANGKSIDVGVSFDIEQLQPQGEERFKLDVRVNEPGEVPITLTAACRDQYGPLPLFPRRCKLDVT